MIKTTCLAAGLTLLLAAAASFAQAGATVNGIHLNGIHLNGTHLNGIHLNGLGARGSEHIGLADLARQAIATPLAVSLEAEQAKRGTAKR